MRSTGTRGSFELDKAMVRVESGHGNRQTYITALLSHVISDGAALCYSLRHKYRVGLNIGTSAASQMALAL